MFTPRHFAETDLTGLDALIARDAFVTLVTVADGSPAVSHLPVLYRREGESVSLRGHWSRANPQSRHAGPALAIVHGPHAYVSPGWYPDKAERARVPTWNYAVAHLHGELEPSTDPTFLAAVVAGLGECHEEAVGGDWRFNPDDQRETAQLRGIVGFVLHVRRVELSFKLNQNHPDANMRSVADALAGSSREADREIAALMRERLARRERGD
ncbi:FMN-binding negative transcriptional regulator [Arenimonas fontis]|uniref:FMN-binding negative transcriptional regulator n=1 Tax=Arenimonas fontis TaxID=2608255 RepID=A0A5B2ZGA0_9GAMM|nr:FMN-binding negative transcriptional regulator [Arenimonas fontis]KAA2286091.1 FMN-binding negative transcriptional regulator [Arenimonas fontis]